MCPCADFPPLGLKIITQCVWRGRKAIVDTSTASRRFASFPFAQRWPRCGRSRRTASATRIWWWWTPRMDQCSCAPIAGPRSSRALSSFPMESKRRVFLRATMRCGVLAPRCFVHSLARASSSAKLSVRGRFFSPSPARGCQLCRRTHSASGRGMRRLARRAGRAFRRL